MALSDRIPYQAIVEAAEDLILRDEARNKADSLHHEPRLPKYLHEENSDVRLVQFNEHVLQGIEARLVHVLHSTHPEDHRGCRGRDLVRHRLEVTGRAKEQGPPQVPDEDLLSEILGKVRLVWPYLGILK